MTQTIERAAARRDTGHRRADHLLSLLTTGLAGLTYLAARAAGVDLAVRGAHGTRHVGPVSVLATAALAAFVGLALLRLLEHRAAHALRTWTVVASLVWVASFLGPLGASGVGSGLALAALHLVVGATVVVGARRTRPGGVA